MRVILQAQSASGINRRLPSRIQSWFELGRVSNLPTLVSNGATGFILGGGSFRSHPFTFLVTLGVTACFYEGGMILNDLCDFHVDSIESPHRPLPSGRISRVAASRAVQFLLALGLVSVILVIPQCLGIAVILIGLIVAYNLRHLQFAFAPMIMGMCRGCIYILFVQAAGWKPFETGAVRVLSLHRLVVIVSLLIAYVSGISWIAREERGSRQWIAPRIVGQALAGISLLDMSILAYNRSTLGTVIGLVCFIGALTWQKKVRNT